MNDWSQRGGVINGGTLAPLHALLILLLYYSYNPAGCCALPTSRFLGEGSLPGSPIHGEGSVALSHHSQPHVELLLSSTTWPHFGAGEHPGPSTSPPQQSACWHLQPIQSHVTESQEVHSNRLPRLRG